MEVFKKNNTETAYQKLWKENEALRQKISELEETLNAKEQDNIDVADNIKSKGNQVKTFQGAGYFYQRVVETMQVGAAMVTPDHRIIYCNRRLTEILNLQGEKILGHSIDEFIYNKDFPSFEFFMTSGLKKSSCIEVRIHSRKGKNIQVLISSDPLSKNFNGTCLIFQDLTELKKTEHDLKKTKKRSEEITNQPAKELMSSNKALNIEISDRNNIEEKLQESEERYRTLFNSLIEGFCIIEVVFDKAGKPVDYRFLEVNKVFEEQTGLIEAQGKFMRELAPEHEGHWFEIYGKIALTGEPAWFVNEAKALNRWYEVRAFRVGGKESRKVAICFYDITERKHLEDEIKLLAKFPSENPNPILRLSHDGKILYANESSKELLQSWKCLIGDFVPENFFNEIKMAFIKGKQENVEITCNNKIISFVVTPIPNERYANLYGNYITERKLAEKNLKESEERFKAIAETAPVGIGVIGIPDPKFLYINAAYEKKFGYREGELLGRKTPDIYWDTKDRDKILNELKETGFVADYEVMLKRKDGTPFWGMSSVRPITFDGKPALLGTFVDVTERRKMEAKLHESYERYQSLVESSPDGVIVHQNGKFVYANSVALQIYGATSLEQLQTRTVLELIHPEDRSIINTRMQQGMGGIKIPLAETRILDFNSKITYVESVGSRIYFQGEPSVQIIIRDISERKKKEFELLKLNQTLRALDKSSQAMVRAKDETSYLDEVCKIIIEDCNYSLVWIGYAREDVDKTVKPMAFAGFEKGYLETLNITWADTERGHGPTGTAIRTGKMSMCRNMLTDLNFVPWREQAIKRGYASSIALPLKVKGKTFGALTIYSREPDPFTEDEAGLLSEIASDLAYGITAIRWRIAQHEAEEKLKKNAAELKELNATKDKFFGIIAHDLKNPFASMLGSSEILSGDPSHFDYETIKKFGAIMYDSAKSGYSLLENLLEWSRSQTGTLTFIPKKINILDIINENITNMTATAINKKIQLYSEVTNDLEITADTNMLNTILRNLLNNAIKFTYPGGKVTVQTEKNENNIIVTVKDTGVGIPKVDIQKLFRIDTKYTNYGTADERGTGLGLLLCKEFVEKHGGRIWVESEEGEGSAFKFTIPLI